jgi:hypothetical protein
VLIDSWLAGLQIGLLPQPTRRRQTVPPKIKRALAEIALRSVQALNPDPDSNWPPITADNIKAVMEWTRWHAPYDLLTLRQRKRKPITPDQLQELRDKLRDPLTQKDDPRRLTLAELEQLRAAGYRDYVQRLENALA